MSSNRILVVEDDPGIQELLAFSLQRRGYEVCTADSAEAALQTLDGPLPALLIIDWMLPGISGVELARRLRIDEMTSDLPLIMLTARGEEADKLRGFEVGIDDYLSKPFSPKELLARVKALLRRAGAPPGGILQMGEIHLDVTAHQASIAGRSLHMGPTEFRLLEFFMRHPERAYSRSQLLDQVWGRGVYLDERTVDVHILRLRKLLRPYQQQAMIQTVRGVGYRLSEIATET